MAEFAARWMSRAGETAAEGVERFGRYLLLGAGASIALTVYAVASRARVAPFADLHAADVLYRAVLGSALFAYTLLELLKRVTSIRGWFHRTEIKRFLEAPPEPSPEDQTSPTEDSIAADRHDDVPLGSGDGPDTGWDQLIAALGEAALGSRSIQQSDPESKHVARALAPHESRSLRYFFALPLERLMGQLVAAVDTALMTPSANVALLRALGGPTIDARLEEIRLARTSEEVRGPEEVGQREPQDELAEERAAEALAIISERVQRGLDSVHVIVGHRWRWFLRTAAVLLAVVVSEVVIVWSDLGGAEGWLVWATASLLGGVLAWSLRDAVAVLERWRS